MSKHIELIVLFNTCTLTGNAEEEKKGETNKWKELKGMTS